MQKILKSVLSILVIGFFLLITLATNIEGVLFESTNTTVKIDNCEMKPEVSGTLRVTVLLLNDSGDPISDHEGLLFVTHQKVDSDSCTYVVAFNQTVPFTTNSQGTFSYEGPQWIHDNSKDLWRAEVKVESTGFYTSYKNVQVKYYDQSDFIFTGEIYIY